MISSLTPIQKRIQNHYDRLNFVYRRLWGEHIHHGYWTDGESPQRAQVQLMERAAGEAKIRPGERVLDAGCGMGGASLWLAQERGARVLAVTLSPVQARAARAKIRLAGPGNLKVICADLETWTLPAGSLDVVWCLESTEHFMDKAAFLRRAAGWLAPGGRIVICAWTAGESLGPEIARQVEAVARDFLCPALATASQYAGWMRQSGLEPTVTEDLTPRVERTWEICRARTGKWWVRGLSYFLGRDTRRFLAGFPTILTAYHTGALRYTLLTGKKV